jgi:uncharacterized protein
MKEPRTFVVAAALVFAWSAYGQQPTQPQLAVNSTNRTVTVSADDQVTAEPEIAILHIGFETAPNDAKSAYAEGARTSNAIISAIKQAGIPESDIRSETQYLDRDPTPKTHKFKLTQRWAVKVPPARAAEILDVAVTNGANSTGQIDWTVKDEHALEDQALDGATTRAREIAAVIAKGMGVRLGNLIYVSNQISGGGVYPRPMMATFAKTAEAPPPPLAIEPQKVSRSANVYAVFTIE